MAQTPGRAPIVVGLDPDPDRRAALVWAADEADRRRLPLVLVLAQYLPSPGYRPTGGRPSWEEWDAALHESGERVVRDSVAVVESRHPDVPVSGLLAEGHPVWVLQQHARGAALVVLGSWHLSAWRERFASAAVALPLAAGAPCPVVVVAEPEHLTHEPPYFVVGVDGSPRSAVAVDFAFEEAALRGALLQAVYVWHPPRLGVLDEHAAVQEGRRVLAETVAGRTADHPEVELRHEVVRGHPVAALTKASEHALGLVVGTRGHGGFTGMMLGSVSQGVLHYARCPVFTVPHTGG